MKRPGPEHSPEQAITYSVISKPAAIVTPSSANVGGRVNNANNSPPSSSPSYHRNIIISPPSRAINSTGVTFRTTSDAPAPTSDLTLPPQPPPQPSQPAPGSPPHLLRYRRGVSLVSLNSSSMSIQDVKSIRDALVRHDASLNRAGSAVNHLRPVDRNVLTARSLFRADPNADVLAQHLRWSTAPTAQQGNPGFAESEVLATARDVYHPIAAPVPQMQISIKQIRKSPPQQSPPSPPQPNQPVLLLQNRPSTNSKQQKIVSIENRPATTSGAVRPQQPQQRQNRPQPQHPASASTTRMLPASADLRKQFDVYQRGTSFLPHQSSTKYLYKSEHGWLVKHVRDRRNNAVTNSPPSSPPQQLVNNSPPTQLATEQLSLETNNAASPVEPPPEVPLSSSPPNRSAVSARLSSSQPSGGRLLLSVNKGPSIPHVNVVDLNAEHNTVHDNTEPAVDQSNNVNNSAENPLKTGAVVNPIRTSVMTKKMHQQPTTQASVLHIEPPPVSSGPQIATRLSSASQHQAPVMMVMSQQHPAAMRAKKLRDLFASYDDFKRAAEDYASHFPKLPQDLTSSPYLNEAKQRQIWCWLHYGENISDVEYLLSVC